MSNRFDKLSDKLSSLIVLGNNDGVDDPAYLREKIAREKNREYEVRAKIYNWFYYIIRLVAGLSAGLLPFFLDRPNVSTALSVVIVVATLLDFVFSPKEKQLLYSEATDLLATIRANVSEPDPNKRWQQAFEVVLKTEAALRNMSRALNDVLTKMKDDKR